MHETKSRLLPGDFPAISRNATKVLQVNLGYRCNQSCVHCHVNAGPNRTEEMSDETVDLLLHFLQTNKCSLLDITGGAPELHPRFRELVQTARKYNIAVRDRCNLTILLEPDQQNLAEFLALQQVEIVASLPCYSEKNVNQQRGKGVFSKSIQALQMLNSLGYAKHADLQLHLVYNPMGPFLPPAQKELKQDYEKHLADEYGVTFNDLFVITNMPIKRFGSSLISTGHFDSYVNTLRESHQQANLAQVMCRDTISIDWQGNVYDCDFNQMLEMPLIAKNKKPLHIRDLFTASVDGLRIQTGNHCYGCTAGQGSSCSGALN